MHLAGRIRYDLRSALRDPEAGCWAMVEGGRIGSAGRRGEGAEIGAEAKAEKVDRADT